MAMEMVRLIKGGASTQKRAEQHVSFHGAERNISYHQSTQEVPADRSNKLPVNMSTRFELLQSPTIDIRRNLVHRSTAFVTAGRNTALSMIR